MGDKFKDAKAAPEIVSAEAKNIQRNFNSGVESVKEKIRSFQKTDPKVFRNPWTRYLGYGFAVATVLPHSLKKTKLLLTISSLGFVTADVMLRTKDKEGEDKNKGVLSSLAWQGLATLLLPAVVAQGAKGVATLLTRSMICKPASSRFDAAAITCLSLPIFSVPIDRAVNRLV